MSWNSWVYFSQLWVGSVLKLYGLYSSMLPCILGGESSRNHGFTFANFQFWECSRTHQHVFLPKSVRNDPGPIGVFSPTLSGECSRTLYPVFPYILSSYAMTQHHASQGGLSYCWILDTALQFTAHQRGFSGAFSKDLSRQKPRGITLRRRNSNVRAWLPAEFFRSKPRSYCSSFLLSYSRCHDLFDGLWPFNCALY